MSISTEYRVYFKHEDSAGSEPVGPVFVERGPAPDTTVLGRPYQTKCVCDHPDAEAMNEWGYPVCKCGGEMEPTWRTLTEAIAIADDYGVELIQS